MKKGAKIAIGVVCGIIAIGAIGSAANNSNDTTVTKGGAESSAAESKRTAEVSSAAESKAASAEDSTESSAPEPESSVPEPESSADTPANGTVTASVGDVVTTKELSFELNKAFTAKKIEDAGNPLLSADADDGKIYLVLEMTVENISDEKQNISTYYFHASVDDFSVDESYLLTDPDGLKYLSGTAMPGKKVKGYLAYEIDENWQSCEIAYTEVLRDEPTFTIQLDRSTVESR